MAPGRLFLHAFSLTLEHPAGGTRHWESPLPADLDGVLEVGGRRAVTPVGLQAAWWAASTSGSDARCCRARVSAWRARRTPMPRAVAVAWSDVGVPRRARSGSARHRGRARRARRPPGGPGPAPACARRRPRTWPRRHPPDRRVRCRRRPRRAGRGWRRRAPGPGDRAVPSRRCRSLRRSRRAWGHAAGRWRAPSWTRSARWRLFGDFHGHADGVAVLLDGTLQGLADPPGGVRRESEAPLPVELVHGPHEAEGPLLDEVGEVHAPVLVAARPVDHQAQVGGDHLAARLVVAGRDALGQLDLLLVVRQRVPVQVVQKQPDAVRCGGRVRHRVLFVGGFHVEQHRCGPAHSGPRPSLYPERQAPTGRPARAGPSAPGCGRHAVMVRCLGARRLDPGARRPGATGGGPMARAPGGGAPRGHRMEPGGAPHRAQRPAPAARGPTSGGGARRPPGRSPFRPGAHEPAAAGGRDVRPGGVRGRGPAVPRPHGVGLRGLRGPHHRRDPGGVPGLVAVGRRRAGGGDAGGGGRARRPGAGSGPGHAG